MPTWLAVALSRTRALFLARRLDDDFDREVSAHLAMLTDEHIRRGLAPEAARRAAVVEFGGAMQIKEQQHDRRGLPVVETTLQDLRYGLRMLLHAKAGRLSSWSRSHWGLAPTPPSSAA